MPKNNDSRRAVIYQMFPRLFANVNDKCVPNGRIEANGSGKMNDITPKVLESIRAMGVTHIWYTGVIEHAHDADYTRFGIARHNNHVIKGRAGSPYAIVDYYDIDPDIAVDVPSRMAEFEALVARTHDAGMGVIIDFVPNHVGRQYHSDAAPAGVEDLGRGDNIDWFFSPSNNFYYIPRQQFAPVDVDLGVGADAYVEFPARATGNDCFTAFPCRNDWYETVKLNYGVDPANSSKHFDPIPPTWFKMLHILRFWASKGVDGFRCDMAHMVPVEFWAWAIASVKKDYPRVQFIAELYDVELYRQYIYDGGFDYLYDKVNLYDTLRGIECNNVSAARLTSCWQTIEGIAPRMLNFLENHDEQRYASDFYAGDASTVIPSLAAIATMSTGAVMIYNGQELGERGMDAEGFSGCDGRTTIFDYWSMDSVRRWITGGLDGTNLTESEKQLRSRYAAVLGLVNGHEAFRVGGFFDLMYVNYGSRGINPHRHYVYMRATANECMFVVLNFDDKPLEADVVIPAHAFEILNVPRGKVTATDLLDSSVSRFEMEPDGIVHVAVTPHNAHILMIVARNDNRKRRTSPKKVTENSTKATKKA